MFVCVVMWRGGGFHFEVMYLNEVKTRNEQAFTTDFVDVGAASLLDINKGNIKEYLGLYRS